MSQLLKSLIIASEKSANVARACRQNEHLFHLLIQQKSTDEANPRFLQDFKTLADVLIQETVRHDIGAQFPELKDRVHGEETNKFCNALGEGIAVEILESHGKTSELLRKVLDGDGEAADLLATEVHNCVNICDVNGMKEIPDWEVDLENVAIWIDPIDSTAEYISGTDASAINSISISGLQCVTVLIGVYDLHTGNPLAGVVNQPFHKRLHEKDTWSGNCYFGLASTRPPPTISSTKKNVICVSGSESPDVKNALRTAGYQLVEAAGAGYKILTTVLGLADAYVLSKPSTFKWDTCGPHALLRSLGGDIVRYESALKEKYEGLNYAGGEDGSKIELHCNRGGIIAYRDVTVFRDVVKVLRNV